MRYPMMMPAILPAPFAPHVGTAAWSAQLAILSSCLWQSRALTSDIRTASIDDAETIGRILGDAFANDPVMAWCLPDRGVRPSRLEAMFRLIASDGYGRIGSSTIVEDTAAALWLPAGTTLGADVWDPLFKKLAVALEGELERIGMVVGMVEEVHPSDTDHWYLLFRSEYGSSLKGRAWVERCSPTACGLRTSGTSQRTSRPRPHAVGPCTNGTASRQP
jgi:hypothetical protein